MLSTHGPSSRIGTNLATYERLSRTLPTDASRLVCRHHLHSLSVRPSSARSRIPRVAPAQSGHPPITIALPVAYWSSSALKQRSTCQLEEWSSKTFERLYKTPLKMPNLHDADSPTGPMNPPSDESGSSNGGSSNCRHHHTYRASSWLIILTNCSLCTNSKSREHTAPRSHIPPTKDR